MSGCARFNELLQEYYEFKKQHSPYDYREWRTGEKTATRCKEILDELAKCIEDLLVRNKILEGGDFSVESASGAGYFPKSPWVGIFKKDECATDGVYPVLGFYNDSEGCFIGCVESFKNPQFGFQAKYVNIAICEQEEEVLKRTGLLRDSHLARMPYVFSSSDQINEDTLLKALQSALDILTEYRRAHPRQEQLSERLNQKTGCIPDKINATWYKEICVDEVECWLSFITSPSVRATDGNAWIFRGHGDSCWHLESSLFRQFGSIGDCAEIKAIETNAIRTFKRESYDSLLCQRLNGVDILAVMQHYGSATRLLDFTYAPLTALFFAIEQRDTLLSNASDYLRNHQRQVVRGDCQLSKSQIEDTVSLAVWAFKLASILRQDEGDPGATLIGSTRDASKIIMGCGNNSSQEDDGIDVVLPRFGNERMSAQSGLFLMARNIGKSFEENLRSILPGLSEISKEDCMCECISNITDWNAATQKFCVLKFVFPPVKVDELKAMLRSLCISYKTIYPDLIGIAKNATSNR